MIFLPLRAMVAMVIGGVVFVVAYAFIRHSTGAANRFGAPSPTMGGVMGRAIVKMLDFNGRSNRKDFWTIRHGRGPDLPDPAHGFNCHIQLQQRCGLNAARRRRPSPSLERDVG